jgi:ectoine hydroxylase-related dioxygenase (phytanoyl-CoA dioxygenase family)
MRVLRESLAMLQGRRRRPTSEAFGEHPVDLGFWQRNGYYVLRNFFSREATDAILQAEKSAWERNAPDVVVDNLIYDFRTPRLRARIGDLTPEQRRQRFVVNDLFLHDADVRTVATDARLISVLRQLLGTEPVLWQSLNFTWGSSQLYHQDTLYLPPPNERDMVVTWIALEDIHPDSGPLKYIPGSHLIPEFRFSDGQLRVVPGEERGWEEHIARHRGAMGLREEQFEAKRGDVFVWHAFLVHGGSEIKDLERTRRSYVAHYYSKADLERTGVTIARHNAGYWCARAPHPVS